jgi:signal transduction histidine kinase
VKDTGIGIPGANHASVFDRFVQANQSLSSGYEGAGLGLAIAKAYVEMLGGKIWLESEEGIGTSFYFTTPCNMTLPEGSLDEKEEIVK